ncbi:MULTISPECIES: hypothetical protein [unclassified Streptomyces]|uniref:hypothetical protein n=1 Tax=unclassified Streptomyces TaxID=2593676 RepID=UPI0037F93380
MRAQEAGDNTNQYLLPDRGVQFRFTVLSDEADGWVAEVWSLGFPGGEVMHILSAGLEELNAY